MFEEDEEWKLLELIINRGMFVYILEAFDGQHYTFNGRREFLGTLITIYNRN